MAFTITPKLRKFIIPGVALVAVFMIGVAFTENATYIHATLTRAFATPTPQTAIDVNGAALERVAKIIDLGDTTLEPTNVDGAVMPALAGTTTTASASTTLSFIPPPTSSTPEVSTNSRL